MAQTERIAAADTPQDAIDSRFFAVVTDLVGTPTELIDEHGDIACRSRSTLWGATAWTADSTAYTPLRFPGQYIDPETELHYNYFRHYDPQTARQICAMPALDLQRPCLHTVFQSTALFPLGESAGCCAWESSAGQSVEVPPPPLYTYSS